VEGGHERGKELVVAEVVELVRRPQQRVVGRQTLPQPGAQQLLAAQGEDPRHGAMTGDVDDDEAETGRPQVDHVVAVPGDEPHGGVQLRGDRPPLGELVDAGAELRPELQDDRRALLDRLARPHLIEEGPVHLQAHGVDVTGEIRDLGWSLWRDDTDLARTRVPDRAGQALDGSGHPAAAEECTDDRGPGREPEDDSDRRIELEAEILEPRLRRAQCLLLRGVEWGSGDEGALLRDDVVTLRTDAQHRRPAREDDDDVYERKEKEAPTKRHDAYCTGTEPDVPGRLPAAEIDRPRVDDLFTSSEMQSLVVGDGRIDVRRYHTDLIADRDGTSRPERDVLVRAVPHGVTDDRRVPVVHAQRLEAAVGDRPSFRHGDHGGDDRQRLTKREVQLVVRGVHERVRPGLDLGDPRVDVERPGAAAGDELAADVGVRVEQHAHRGLRLLLARRSIRDADDVALVAHHSAHAEPGRARRVGQRSGALDRTPAARHADEHVDHDLLQPRSNGGVDRRL